MTFGNERIVWRGLKEHQSVSEGETVKKFYACSNNGVLALMGEDAYNNTGKCNRIRMTLNDPNHRAPGRDIDEPLDKGLAHIPITPVFTFTHNERFAKSPWFTGGGLLLEVLYECVLAGGKIEEGWFYVPFSNGAEIGMHGDRAMVRELSYVTTAEQFRETFGSASRSSWPRRRSPRSCGHNNPTWRSNTYGFSMWGFSIYKRYTLQVHDRIRLMCGSCEKQPYK